MVKMPGGLWVNGTGYLLEALGGGTKAAHVLNVTSASTIAGTTIVVGSRIADKRGSR